MAWIKLIQDGATALLRRPVMLEAGTQAPEFSVMAHDGTTVTLSEFRGKKVILWFYPKANTGG